MKVQLTRDSVANGDDDQAPHEKTLTVPDTASLDAILQAVLNSRYLALIGGGKATWSANSRIPVAVVAQQWEAPKLLAHISPAHSSLRFANDTLHLHFQYHRQEDPDEVYAALLRSKLFLSL